MPFSQQQHQPEQQSSRISSQMQQLTYSFFRIIKIKIHTPSKHTYSQAQPKNKKRNSRPQSKAETGTDFRAGSEKE